MSIEKFKSHQQLRDRCLQLVQNNEKVCQTILDYASSNIEYLSNFNLERDFIYQEKNELDENYNMYKVGRYYDYNTTIH